MPKAVDALCKHLDSLVEDLRNLSPAALREFDEKSIHKARVATRRVKAALDLLKPALQTDRRKPFARVGKKLRHRLGPLRDLDVMLGHLDEIKSESYAPAVTWLRQRLQQDRDAARQKTTQKDSTDRILTRLGDWPALRGDISNLGDSVPSMLLESVHLQLDRFVENAEHLTGDAHPLRISGKALRYTMELLKASRHPIPAKVLRTFKRMQDMLGLWHDYIVLAECAMRASVDSQIALHDGATQRNVIELVRYALKKAQQNLDQFAKLWKEKGVELAAMIREACPLSEPPAVTVTVTVPQTDPGPADLPQQETAELGAIIPPPAA